jgi:pantoate--beta-alanine ligase
VRIVRSNAQMRAAVGEERAAGRSVGLVPTMGAFHGGHHALMRAARERCDTVVVSLFVNPAQFDEAADLAAYPRDEARDAADAAELGVDVLYAPPVEEVYPAGFATSVRVDGLADVLEGAQRGPGHFAGVCTVVAKLLNVVTPDAVFFGQKDAQQVAVVRRMVRDLDLPVALEVVPTVREADGLAMSSRNRRLDATERDRALALSRALQAAETAVIAGERDAAAIKRAARGAMGGVEPEYLALVDPDSFEPVQHVNGRVLVAVAARIGATRLIDNALVHTAATPGGAPTP